MTRAMPPRAGHAFGPRMPLKMRDVTDIPSQVIESRAMSHIARRADTETISVTVGVIIPLFLGFIVLVYLHRRSVRRQRQEDLQDPHKSLDFGLGESINKEGKGGKRMSIMGLGKDHSKYRQMSMDMNLSSPYLLPPEHQTSRESMARSLNQNEDPYRPVIHYAASDAASMRTMPKGRAVSSIYTVESHDPEHFARSNPVAKSARNAAGSRQDYFPKSPTSPLPPAYMRPASMAIEDAGSPPAIPVKDPFRSPGEFSLPEFTATPYPADEPTEAVMPAEPVVEDFPAPAHHIARKPMGTQMQDALGTAVGHDANGSDGLLDNLDFPAIPAIGQAQTTQDIHYQSPPTSPPQDASEFMAQPEVRPPSGTLPQISPLPPIGAALSEEPEEDFGDHWSREQQQHDDEQRGRTMQRQSINPQAVVPTGGLGIPQQDTRRISIGMRPLPPEDIMDTEDPETRANRIRSFYREYFDDSKPDPMPMPPAIGNRHHGGPAYYEGYDDNYSANGQAYYDPNTNAFVMPYAQPVGRRAMTPPPSGSRFPGGPPPRPRHGPSASGYYSPRPGSSASHAYGRPRAGSTMSGGRWGKTPKKPMPPPADLSTLPNPSKLKDDSLAIFGSLDFAPPETFKDRAAGRPQSPAGERFPYQKNLPSHSPLVNAFDELAVLPSPHLLRKSGAFTGLDFAPPRKFTELDSRSDTGSIRSNRSGLSALQVSALRSGAGRVSRLPEDTIFTAAQQQQQLKPSWGMRD